MRRKRKIKVKYSNTWAKDQLYGFAYVGKDTIVIDQSLKGKKHLEILIHEVVHCLFPEMEEKETVEKSIILTDTVWKESYRRVDNTNKIKLQDGSL